MVVNEAIRIARRGVPENDAHAVDALEANAVDDVDPVVDAHADDQRHGDEIGEVERYPEQLHEDPSSTPRRSASGNDARLASRRFR